MTQGSAVRSLRSLRFKTNHDWPPARKSCAHRRKAFATGRTDHTELDFSFSP